MASCERPHTSIPRRDYVNNSPEDVILIFLSLLGTRDLVRSRRVCRLWCSLIDSDISLQYKIALWASGTHDDPTSGVGLEERLTRLRSYQSLWMDPHFTCDRGYKLSGDLSNPDGEFDWEAFPSSHGSIVYIVRDGSLPTVVVCIPPSILGTTQKRVWTSPVHAISGTILGVAVDVAQDLLLVIESARYGTGIVKFCCFSLAGNSQQQHDVEVSMTRADDGTVDGPYSTAVCGQHVCWILDSGALEVWDWRVGTRIWRCEIPIVNDLYFTFIDTFHLAVISDSVGLLPVPPTLDIYRIPPQCSDQRVSFPGNEGPICSLRMPSPIHLDFSSITVRSLSCNAHSAPPSSVPRYDLDECALGSSLLVIYFSVSQPGVESEFALLIPPWTLDREIRESLTRHPMSGSKTAINWDDWGPRGGLILPLCQQIHDATQRIQQSGNVALGLRYALLPPFRLFGIVEHKPLVLLDFSHVAAAEPWGAAGNTTAAQLVLKSTLAPRTEWERIFPESVMQSKLPYRIIVGPDKLRPRAKRWQRVPADLVMHSDGFTVVYSRSEYDRPSFDTFHL
ncbi:hypothetical protein C8Q70DRAFT_958019 [Cubamyces menziesii]|nr:hypothetical protein C8Q70DRAFT_958019 [Cubamyces menziesii]